MDMGRESVNFYSKLVYSKGVFRWPLLIVDVQDYLGKFHIYMRADLSLTPRTFLHQITHDHVNNKVVRSRQFRYT